MVYVALLRGINVGGNNKINMKELKTSFERIGMENVTTYINSGNIIFTHDSTDCMTLTGNLENLILDDFGLSIKVLLRDIEEYKLVMDALPEHWQNDKVTKCDVMFLWDGFDMEDFRDGLKLKPDIDTAVFLDSAVLIKIERSGYSRSGLAKLAGSKWYKQMTIRNVNTTRKIWELMQATSQL